MFLPTTNKMKEYPALNLPPVELKVKEEDGQIRVFDKLRDKWIVLTPEEWVRQHFVGWLQADYHYPASLIANETGIEVNGTKKRCDTVIFRSDGSPLIIVEYKAPEIAITQSVFDQAVRYNMYLKADYLIVSNGINHYCCKIDYINNTYNFIPKIPSYHQIATGASEN